MVSVYIINKSRIVLISSVLFCVANGIVMVTPECETTCYYDLAPMIISGFAYGCFSGIQWALIPMVVEERIQGTAYGIASSVLNMSLAIVPTLGSWIHDQTLESKNGFFWVRIVSL